MNFWKPGSRRNIYAPDSAPLRPFPSPLFPPDIDGLIVLGARLNPREEPGRVGQMRVIHALKVWRHCDLRVYVLLTGGCRPGSRRSEARAMADWAMIWVRENWGEAVMEDLQPCLILEETSRTTAASALHTLPLVQARGSQIVGLVSDSLHIPRANLIFQRHFRHQGINIHPLPAPGLVHHYWRSRRFLGLAKMTLREGGAWIKALGQMAFQAKGK